MNYFRQIRAFRIRKKFCQLSAPDIALWFALMNIGNELGQYDGLNLSESTLMEEAGLSRSSLYRSRNKLQQLDFISWRSRKGRQSAIYSVTELVLQYEAQTEAQSGAQIEAQSGAQTGPIYLRNATETDHLAKKTFNNGWKTSERARGAVAQSLLDGWNAIKGNAEVATPGRDPHQLLCDYMQGGMEPEAIRGVLSECHDPWYLESRLYLRACELGMNTETGAIEDPGRLYFRRTTGS